MVNGIQTSVNKDTLKPLLMVEFDIEQIQDRIMIHGRDMVSESIGKMILEAMEDRNDK